MEARTDLWLANLVAEREGTALYSGLALAERDPARADTFRKLADVERRHMEVWAKKLRQAGVELPPERPSPRVKVLLWLARRLGTSAVLPFVLAAEASDADKYARQGGDAAKLADEEREHGAVLEGLRDGASDPQAIIVRRERWHRTGSAGGIRAAIFGMNDGIVSNLSLVLGVAGAGADRHLLVLTGFSGLLAGACSMAVGEYTSVASQRDLLLRQIELERREVEQGPEEEAAELAQILMNKGVSANRAEKAATEILKNPEQALDMLVREELGLNPDDLGAPLSAATSSFGMFAVGALVPLLPFLLFRERALPVASVVLSCVTLAGVGAGVGVLSGTSPWRTAWRMVALAALAAAVTFGLGKAFGVAVS